MRNDGKKNVIGILVDTVDYEGALDFIFRAAEKRRGAAISALAVHGVMTGALDATHRHRLNHFDLVVPDGQPVRWALNFLYQAALPSRVYGPELTLRLCERAAAENVGIYLYGSTPQTLLRLQENLKQRFPGIVIAGAEPSKFRRLSSAETDELACRISASGASMLFVGLGCPRQEIFAFEFRDRLPMPIIAIGAAFPFIAGEMPQAPRWMQDRGLEWFFRLGIEPKRLWRRYLYLNPAYVLLLMVQALRLNRFSTSGPSPIARESFG